MEQAKLRFEERFEVEEQRPRARVTNQIGREAAI